MFIYTKRSNNGIMDRSCGQFQQMWAEDGKLNSNLEWPNIK